MPWYGTYSAEWYYNEQAVGRAINQYLASPSCPISRSDVFYCTKLQANHGYDAAKRSIAQSLDRCGLGYIDLYLVHSPYGGKQRRRESWTAIQEAKEHGLVRSVGVSNYGQRHIEELLASEPKYRPVINQCDLHPFMARPQLVEWCRSKGIEMEVSLAGKMHSRAGSWFADHSFERSLLDHSAGDRW